MFHQPVSLSILHLNESIKGAGEGGRKKDYKIYKKLKLPLITSPFCLYRNHKDSSVTSITVLREIEQIVLKPHNCGVF
jgi:hypothetical protein